jgi:hypothetical protein
MINTVPDPELRQNDQVLPDHIAHRRAWFLSVNLLAQDLTGLSG